MGTKIAGGLLGAEFKHRAKDVLSSRFLVAPFSVLNAREGWWQERKQRWLDIGIRSELGRGENLLKMSDTVLEPDPKKRALLKKADPFKGGRWVAPDGKVLGAYMGRNSAAANPTDDTAALRRLAGPNAGPVRMETARRKLVAQRGLVRKEAKNVYLYPQGEDGVIVDGERSGSAGGTSVFDPVLCELVYRWFAPPGGSVLDPFSGGSVRGIVAAELGLEYFGMDLSARQLAANEEQARTIGSTPAPTWLCGDSLQAPELLEGPFDLLFSCPPYGDLERYSDDPLDLSTLSFDAFLDKYNAIIAGACSLLGENGFACFVVGDYRDKDGFCRNLQGRTVDAFEAAGLRLYNTCILVTSAGSLPLRINAAFSGSRKLGTTHQYLLVFAKGQPKDFVKKWPAVEIA